MWGGRIELANRQSLKITVCSLHPYPPRAATMQNTATPPPPCIICRPALIDPEWHLQQAQADKALTELPQYLCMHAHLLGFKKKNLWGSSKGLIQILLLASTRSNHNYMLITISMPMQHCHTWNLVESNGSLSFFCSTPKMSSPFILPTWTMK